MMNVKYSMVFFTKLIKHFSLIALLITSKTVWYETTNFTKVMPVFDMFLTKWKDNVDHCQ